MAKYNPKHLSTSSRRKLKLHISEYLMQKDEKVQIQDITKFYSENKSKYETLQDSAIKFGGNISQLKFPKFSKFLFDNEIL